MFDDELMLRDTAAGTLVEADDGEEGDWIDFGSPDIGERTYAMYVPSVAGTTPKLNVKIQVADVATVIQEFSFEADIAAAGIYYLTFATSHAKRRFYAGITGANADFGIVLIGMVAAAEYNKV